MIGGDDPVSVTPREAKKERTTGRDAGCDRVRCKTPGKGRMLVLGLGNPFLTDDAVGLLVTQKVRDILPAGLNVEVRQGSVAGFDLLDTLCGFQRVIVVDAIKTADGTPGSVYRLTPEDLPASERLAAAHEISLPTALSLGRLMGVEMPAEVVIVAIEIEDNRSFSETCCPAVAAAIDSAAALVLLEISGRPDKRPAPVAQAELVCSND